ncbi:MAG TPA: hypothetical protein VEK15_12320 [Vicinamibacteria bacterium]|nr:hypothetical protein [Vicinamibacteria bacterium]
MDTFVRLVSSLQEPHSRFVVIGAWGANYYAASGTTLFTTLDRHLFVPNDAANLVSIWSLCESTGLDLRAGDEPLDFPRDDLLAKRMIELGAVSRASDGRGLEIDLTPVMAGFDFEEVWEERRVFFVEGVEVPVARLSHIIASKMKVGRPKDILFLETHAQALKELRRLDDE